MHYDIIFYSHASNLVGFGHAARCAKLHKALQKIDSKLSLAFMGKFEDSAKSLLVQLCNPIFIENGTATVGIYDRMDDSEHPHIWSSKNLNQLTEITNKVIFLANGINHPRLPNGVICVGYKPSEDRSASNPDFYWDLKYAPFDGTPQNVNELKYDNEKKILIALGGGATTSALKKVINACKGYNSEIPIKLLLSPVNNIDESAKNFYQIDKLEILKNVPHLNQHFQTSSIIIASYGHLGYEAMASQRPVCLVGQKQFQFDYAERLAHQNLCVSAGLLEEISENELTKAIENTFLSSKKLILNTSKNFDGAGISRIANLIYKTFSLVK